MKNASNGTESIVEEESLDINEVWSGNEWTNVKKETRGIIQLDLIMFGN